MAVTHTHTHTHTHARTHARTHAHTHTHIKKNFNSETRFENGRSGERKNRAEDGCQTNESGESLAALSVRSKCLV